MQEPVSADRLSAAREASAQPRRVWGQPGSALGLLIGILGAALAFRGIQFMQVSGPGAALPTLPTGMLADVFPNPQWVALGTACCVVGCVLAALCLPSDTLQPAAPDTVLSVRDPRHAADENNRHPSAVGVTLPSDPPAPRLPPSTSLGRPQGSPLQRPPASRRSPWAIRAGPGVRRKPLGIGAGMAALLLYAYVVVQALSHAAGIPVLLALIAATVLCGACVAWLAPPSGPSDRAGLMPLSWIDAAVIAVVAGAFIALTMHDAWNWLYAYIGDEWAFYDRAREILLGTPVDMLSQAGVYGIHPLADSAYMALVMKLAGASVAGWRLSSILAVAVPIIPLYWLGKAIGGTMLALAASVLYATCHLLWAFAHIGYNNNDPLLAMVPAAALLYAGMRYERAWCLFAAGACAGAGWYTLFTGRLMIGIVLLVLLTEWRGGARAVVYRIALALGGFALVALPLAIDNGADTIRQMFPLVSLSQARTTVPASHLLAQNTVRGIYAFLYATENSHYVVGAVFDAVSAAALCIGFALALRRVRSLEARLLLIWFLVTLLLSTPLYYVPQIADTRLQVAVPPAALLAALGLCATARGIGLLWDGRGQTAVTGICLVAALAAAAALNYDRFYRQMPGQLAPTSIAMTIGVLTQHADVDIVLGGELSDNNLCQVLDGYQIDPGRVLRFSGGLVTPQCAPPAPQQMTPRPVQLVVLSSQGRGAVQSCASALFPLLVAPNKQQVLWGYRLTVPATPAGDFPLRLAQAAGRVCPGIVGLPPA